MKKFTVLLLLMCIISGCNSGNEDEIKISHPLKLKPEYTVLVGDEITVEMIGGIFSLVVDGYNKRDKKSGNIVFDESVHKFSDFISAEFDKAIESKSLKKAEFLVEVQSAYIDILKSVEHDFPVLSKNSEGEYAIEDNPRISEEKLNEIKENLLTKIDVYFE